MEPSYSTRTYKRTDMTKLIVAFRKLRKRLKMYLCNKAWKSRLAQNIFFLVERLAPVSKV